MDIDMDYNLINKKSKNYQHNMWPQWFLFNQPKRDQQICWVAMTSWNQGESLLVDLDSELLPQHSWGCWSNETWLNIIYSNYNNKTSTN